MHVSDPSDALRVTLELFFLLVGTDLRSLREACSHKLIQRWIVWFLCHFFLSVAPLAPVQYLARHCVWWIHT